ncbi:MAG TPA: ATP-dependent 6-phosphofructokinase [Phycisphaerae bacterium]|nr:ATP-dependent 6-phosphofructokinase [Phycisphaerae bacterium]
MNDSDRLRRIGVMSGGGDCPGLNAVIRAVTKTAISDHALEVYGIEDGFLGLIENRIRPLSYADVSNILNLGGTILGASNRADPANFCVGEDADGKPICKDVSDRVIEYVSSRRLDAIVCIGGDGTMTAAAKLALRGLHFVGAPKTIDNDLMHTEVTFGFHTAVETATEALDRIRTTAASHSRVMLVELMGRNAGWLTLYAGIAAGADLILIPEIPFSLDAIIEQCLARSRKGKAYTLIAVAEGAAPIGGEVVVDRVVRDSPDPIRLGGISQVLCEQIGHSTHLECRATILGHVQRGGTPCPYDRVLGTQFGHQAVKLLMAGQYDCLVVMQNGRLTSVPLAEVAGKQRTVPPDHPLIAAARATGSCFGDEGAA